MLVVYFVNYFIEGYGAARGETWNLLYGWRWMFGSEAVPALMLFVLMFAVPESPRWLVKNWRDGQSTRHTVPRGWSPHADAELAAIRENLARESGSLLQLLRPGQRLILLIGVSLAILQQVTGINVILYYAPEIFKDLGFAVDVALLQTVAVGAINVLFTLVAIWSVDRFGRKPLMICGAAGMGVSLLVIGLAFYFQRSGAWVVIFVLGYIACFAMSLGPVVWVILSEIFPMRIRGRAMAIATTMLWISCYLVSQTFPMLNDEAVLVRLFHHALPFWVYSVFCRCHHTVHTRVRARDQGALPGRDRANVDWKGTCIVNPRDTLKRALNHQAGPIPIDFGSTAVTGIHVTAVEALRKHYGLESRPVKVVEPYQMLGLVEDDLVEALGICTAGVPAPKTIFGFPLRGWKEWRAPWGQDVLVAHDFQVVAKDDGVYIYPEGDTSAPPSGHMPTASYFFDTIVRQPDLGDAEPDVEDNLEEFGPIDDEALTYLKTETRAAAATGRAVVGTLPGTAFGDIALVPAPFLKHPKGMRDIAEWYMSTAGRQEFVHKIFEKQLEYALANLEKIHAAVGESLDVVFLCGTDFGTQTSSFCSPDTFDELWLPYYKTMNDWIHATHDMEDLEALLRRGRELHEPLYRVRIRHHQPGAVLGDRHGSEDLERPLRRPVGLLGRWRGYATDAAVRHAGAGAPANDRAMRDLRPGGGFVFNTIHNIQAGTPVANIVAMFDAVKEFGA